MMQPFTAVSEVKRIGALGTLSNSAVVLASHPRAPEDRDLELSMLRAMLAKRRAPMLVCLDALPPTLQPAVDEYVESRAASNEDALAQLRRSGAWREGEHGEYLQLLEFARELKGVSVACVGVPLGVKESVLHGGIESVSPQLRQSVVADPRAFVQYVKTPVSELVLSSVRVCGMWCKRGLHTKQNSHSIAWVWCRVVW